jgi:D-arabinose 1-dehydrogenase-like Zn-dependent alcohol dehydrogenase
MLEFCGAHNITADVEVIPNQNVNEAYDRLRCALHSSAKVAKESGTTGRWSAA